MFSAVTSQSTSIDLSRSPPIAQPAGIVIDGMYRNQVEALRGRLESAGLDTDRSSTPTKCAPVLDDLRRGHRHCRDDLALIQYTSGSTGRPKAFA